MTKELGQPQAQMLIHRLFVSAGIQSVQSVLSSKEEEINMQLAQQAGFDSNYIQFPGIMLLIIFVLTRVRDGEHNQQKK